MTFKQEVIKNCNGVCENPNCDSKATTVHHFFKQSTYPKYRLDPDNGMGCCGVCHSEIEDRLRRNLSYEELYPIDRYLNIINRIKNQDYWIKVHVKHHSHIRICGIDDIKRKIDIIYGNGLIIFKICDKLILEINTYTQDDTINLREIIKYLGNRGILIII